MYFKHSVMFQFGQKLSISLTWFCCNLARTVLECGASTFLSMLALIRETWARFWWHNFSLDFLEPRVEFIPQQCSQSVLKEPVWANQAEAWQTRRGLLEPWARSLEQAEKTWAHGSRLAFPQKHSVRPLLRSPFCCQDAAAHLVFPLGRVIAVGFLFLLRVCIFQMFRNREFTERLSVTHCHFMREKFKGNITWEQNIFIANQFCQIMEIVWIFYLIVFKIQGTFEWKMCAI